jgi:hypothetical protein
MGALMSLALAAPALAAKPTREVINLATPEGLAADSEFVTTLCGFDVVASGTGRVIVHVFTDNSGAFRREIDGYLIDETFTNVETGASVTLHDVGPDLVWVGRDGSLYLAITGRSLTGSGNIGRVLVNLDSGETLSISGKDLGSLDVLICEALAS